MARRHLTFTLTFTLDEDDCRRDDIPIRVDGDDSRYSETLDLLRTALHHQAALILSPYDPLLDPPDVKDHGIDYVTTPTSGTDDANF